jgi:hypothetical protein
LVRGPEARSAPGPRSERPQAFDVLRMATCKVDERGFIHKPKPFRRPPYDPMSRGAEVGKPRRRDRNVCHTPKVEREGPGLAHACRSVTVHAIHARGLASGPRLAGGEGEPYDVLGVAAGAEGDRTDMARPRLRRVLTLRVVAPNEIAGPVGASG